MKIILIEDEKDYAETLIGFLPKILSYRDGDLLFGGGFHWQTKDWLKEFIPPLRDKLVFIVDGTLNFKEGEELGVPGNGFTLFSDWLSDLIKQMQETGEQESLNSLLPNILVILNTGTEKNLKDDFPSYAGVKEICQRNGLLLMENCPKASGPIIEAINRFVLPEGINPGVERK